MSFPFQQSVSAKCLPRLAPKLHVITLFCFIKCGLIYKNSCCRFLNMFQFNFDYIDCYLGDDEEDTYDVSVVSTGDWEANKENRNNNNPKQNSIENEDIVPMTLYQHHPYVIPHHVQEICRIHNLPVSFKNRADTKYFIRMSQCRIGRHFTIPRSERKGYHIKCASYPKCNFNILVRKTDEYGELIRDGDALHTCDINEHIIKHNPNTSPAACSEFLARYLRVQVQDGICSLKACTAIILSHLKCKVPPSTVHRGIVASIKKYVHDDDTCFSLLESYVQHVKSKNGYGFLDVILYEDDEDNLLPPGPPTHRFLSMFISLPEQKQYAAHAKYVCIDATHLTGKFGCILMSASTLDANGRLVIIAHAICPTENTACWRFFLHHFKMAGLGESITFIMSDRDKGLINAVSHHFPGLPHTKCLRHLSENFKKRFGEESTKILKAMACVYTKSDLVFYRDELRKGGEHLITWVANADPTMWCRALFPIPRYGVITSNTIEIVFSALKKAKHLPFLQLFLFIERYILRKKYSEYLKYNEMDPSNMVLKAEKIFNIETEKSLNLRCFPTSNDTASVKEFRSEDIQHYSVDMIQKTCTCGRYQELKLPCRHVIAYVRGCLHQNPKLFCDQMYSIGNVQKMYTSPDGTYSVATTLENLYALGETNLNPPEAAKVKRGRKRVNRIESQSKSVTISKKRVSTCPICGKSGHYQKSCKEKSKMFHT
jgi:MULE transposase domain/SWIM zinc finger